MYNLWENMYSKTALCFVFLALYFEHVWYAQLLWTCALADIAFSAGVSTALCRLSVVYMTIPFNYN
jgi:ABC-type polysaccharide/polyol phosphate export permease